MIRIALILLFGTAVFATTFVVLNPEMLSPAQENEPVKPKGRVANQPSGDSSLDCPGCPLPSN